MIIGFKYVNKEEGNRIKTNQLLLQQGRFRSDVRRSSLTTRIAKCQNRKIENLHLCVFLRTV